MLGHIYDICASFTFTRSKHNSINWDTNLLYFGLSLLFYRNGWHEDINLKLKLKAFNSKYYKSWAHSRAHWDLQIGWWSNLRPYATPSNNTDICETIGIIFQRLWWTGLVHLFIYDSRFNRQDLQINTKSVIIVKYALLLTYLLINYILD